MKIALIVEKQFHQKPKPQERLHLSLLLPEQLTLEDISPTWASRLKKENLPTFMSSTWLQWRSELQKTSIFYSYYYYKEAEGFPTKIYQRGILVGLLAITATAILLTGGLNNNSGSNPA